MLIQMGTRQFEPKTLWTHKICTKVSGHLHALITYNLAYNCGHGSDFPDYQSVLALGLRCPVHVFGTKVSEVLKSCDQVSHGFTHCVNMQAERCMSE